MKNVPTTKSAEAIKDLYTTIGQKGVKEDPIKNIKFSNLKVVLRRLGTIIQSNGVYVLNMNPGETIEGLIKRTYKAYQKYNRQYYPAPKGKKKITVKKTRGSRRINKTASTNKNLSDSDVIRLLKEKRERLMTQVNAIDASIKMFE